MDKHQYIIDRIKAVRAIQPPASFTDNIMKQLPDRYPMILYIGSFAYQLYNLAMAPDGDNKSGLTYKECSFYFIITGLFYLVIGVIMAIGLHGISSGIDAMGWINLQPKINIGVALGLLAFGALLIVDGNLGVKAARFGTLIYLFFVLINGLLMRQYLNIPFAGIFIIGFVAASAFMGIMLAQAVNKAEVKTV
jgi:hypothetical protein